MCILVPAPVKPTASGFSTLSELRTLPLAVHYDRYKSKYDFLRRAAFSSGISLVSHSFFSMEPLVVQFPYLST